MDSFAVHGIDVSHYQSHIDWDKVASQDISFAFVKATEGEMMKDSLFCNNWQEMQRVGIKRGAYHFFRPSLSVEQQAQNFIKNVDIEFGDMPPVLDVEVVDGVSSAVLVEGVQKWLDIVEAHYHVKPILYTNLKFHKKYIAKTFTDYPIWIARYSYERPMLTYGQEWLFWQYGNRGRLKGINGDVDFNVFYGSMAELEDFCLSPGTALSSIYYQ